MSEPERNERGEPVYSARDVSQGEIILRTRARRIIFLSGLVGMVLLGLVLLFLR